MTDNDQLDAIAIDRDARSGERMLLAVYNFLGRFVSYPSEAARVAHALWIIHTHLMDRWESTPRIAFLSAEPGSGKSRALDISFLLVHEPVQTVNCSPAYLFRKVGSEGGVTILYDEIDTVFGPKAKDNEDIRGLLNAGHHKGATVGRCVVRGNTIETEEIEAYSAVALAGLGWLPDTILTRSIIVRMRKRHAGEHVEAYRKRIHRVEGERVREAIKTWARTVPAEIDLDAHKLPAEIEDRDADVWESLIAIADLVGGNWPERARAAAVALVTASKETEPSLGVRLLTDLQAVFGEAYELPSKTILQKLTCLEESPWADLRGRPLDERGLANRLRQYGIKSRTIRVGDTTPKGYRREDLFDAWARYLPPSPDKSATSATSATGQGVADVADVLPLPDGEPDPEGWQFQHDDSAA